MTRKSIHPAIRVMSFITGIAILIILMVIAIDWDNMTIEITLAGANVTTWTIASLLVLGGVIATTLIKSALQNKWRLDN